MRRQHWPLRVALPAYLPVAKPEIPDEPELVWYCLAALTGSSSSIPAV
jgi:hypothetical protein